MVIGTVKWFNAGMGFGVIAPDNGNEDLFVHFYTIDLNGFKPVKEGQKVKYEVVQGAKGKQAANIQVAS